MSEFFFTRLYNRFDIAFIMIAFAITPASWLGVLEFVGLLVLCGIISGFCEWYFETV